MPIDLDWNSIRPLNGSKHNAFEELCTQIARATCLADVRFERKGTPDSGVEAYAVHPDQTEWAWQAKYFQSMGESQWKQLDKSVVAALDGHPRLVRFVACVSCDLPDGRSPGQTSGRDRWNARVSTWTKLARKKGMAVEFVWAGSHELLTTLARPEHAGLLNFFFGRRHLDDAWLRARLSEAHQSAGPRYTPELNVKLSLAERFHALGRTREFFVGIQSKAIGIKERVRSHAFNVTQGPDPVMDPFVALARTACDAVLAEFASLPDAPILAAPLDKLHTALRDAVRHVDALISELWRQAEAVKAAPAETGASSATTYQNTHGLRELRSQLVDAYEDVTEHRDIVDRKLLILTGEAGTGKTHLLCDLAQQRLDAGLPTVVLMGQRFLEASDPWTQALQQLDLQGWTAQQFVGVLEVLARRAGRRLLLIIDALNEGAGARLWREQLVPFLGRVSGSPWITTVISVRSSYLDGLVPEQVVEAAFHLEHRGFDNVEFDATSTFFAHYGIDLPSTPLLAPEFRNPLYLKTLCRGLRDAGETRLPRGFHGVVSAFKLYLDGVNRRLAIKLDFDRHADLVAKALDGLARRMVAAKRSWLPYPEAQEVVEALLTARTYSRSLMTGLLDEGLLVEERYWHKASGQHAPAIVIGYERLSDYLCARVTLEDALEAGDVRSAFERDGPLDLRALREEWGRQGFHEALHILVAEKTGKELLTLVPDLGTLHQTNSAFLGSLVWRDPQAMTPEAVPHLIELKESRKTQVIETLITLATIPGHPLNAQFTDTMLRQVSMADRDAWWTTGLHPLWGQKGAVDRLIHWADRLWPHDVLESESTELTATIIAWLLTSSNRYLRDHATKSLVRVLTWRPELAAHMVSAFAQLDDAYVAERVLAAVFGASTRTNDTVGVKSVANVVYARVFANGGPRPHILLREYANGIIKRAQYLLGATSTPQWTGIDPPYATEWPAIPDDAMLETIAPRWSKDVSESFSWSHHRIRSSVMDDDFGRYIIGTNFWSTNWLSLPLDQPPWLSFEKRAEQAVASLSKPQHRAWTFFENAWSKALTANWNARFETLPIPGVSVRKTRSKPDLKFAETLAKARQRLLDCLDPQQRETFSPLLAEMASNSERGHRPKFNLKLAQRYILGRVFELGWTSERFEEFDGNLETHGREAHKAERIGKKYQWIAYHEMLAFMADHYQYTSLSGDKGIGTAYRGSWQDNFRDIDPTNVMLSPAYTDEDATQHSVFWVPVTMNEWKPSLAARPWAQVKSDVPRPSALLFSRDTASATEWVNLWMDHKWSMPRPPYEDSYRDGRREIWMNIDGALVERASVARLLSRDTAKQLRNSTIHINENHEIFLGEIGWSEAAEHFRSPYYGHSGWPSALGDLHAVQASFGYLRERGSRDCSIGGESVRFRAPSEGMLSLLDARWSGVSATYVNQSGLVVAFDPSVNVAGPSALLLRRETLLKILRHHDLVVCWVVHGEKVDAEGAPDYGFNARRSFNGVFLWDGGEMRGSYTFEPTETPDRDDG